MAGTSEVGYSGTYSDVTDLGIVATAVKILPNNFKEATVMAVDVDIGTNWISTIADAEPNTRVLSGPREFSWRSLDLRSVPEVQRLAQQCTDSDRPSDGPAICQPGKAHFDDGVVAILVGSGPTQLSQSEHTYLVRWNIVSYPTRYFADAVPMVAIWACGFLLWRADRSKRFVELVDSLDVVAVTIDPNDDRVRFRNQRARQLGIEEGAVFRDYVYDTDHNIYDESNRAAGRKERSYSIRLWSGQSCMALIRSTAVPFDTPDVNARANDRFALISILTPSDN
jgi:hypothetical protein